MAAHTHTCFTSLHFSHILFYCSIIAIFHYIIIQCYTSSCGHFRFFVEKKGDLIICKENIKNITNILQKVTIYYIYSSYIKTIYILNGERINQKRELHFQKAVCSIHSRHCSHFISVLQLSLISVWYCTAGNIPI